jgi:formate/nitrite transporter FocA (FNT family)
MTGRMFNILMHKKGAHVLSFACISFATVFIVKLLSSNFQVNTDFTRLLFSVCFGVGMERKESKGYEGFSYC